MFSSNPEAIIITRLGDARIVEVNAAWERHSGHRREAVMVEGSSRAAEAESVPFSCACSFSILTHCRHA